MAEREAYRYLAIVLVTPATPERLVTLVPALVKILEEISVEPILQVFRSATADHFGYFLRSKLAAREIRALIESPDKDYFQRDRSKPVMGGFLPQR